jgi:rubrerythrin
MHTYDPQQAQRVWQRVQAGQDTARETAKEEARNDNLQELIMNEWNAAATYLRLARQMGPGHAQVLQRLGREEHGHAACLKGIYHLITGRQAVTGSPKPEQESPELTLRKCYGREMRSLKEYEARMGDPEYGHVFAKLAEQEREHCRAVLELIGSLGKKQ